MTNAEKLRERVGMMLGDLPPCREGPVPCTPNKSYLCECYKEAGEILRAVVEELDFGTPTVNSLRDVGEGHPFTEVLADHLAALLKAAGGDDD